MVHCRSAASLWERWSRAALGGVRLLRRGKEGTGRWREIRKGYICNRVNIRYCLRNTAADGVVSL